MKNLIIALSIVLGSAIISLAQDMPKFEVDKLPVEAAKPEAFVHAGWTVEEVIQGDLNGDGKADAAIKLTNGVKNENGSSGDRALVIAFYEGGKWRRVATSKGILQCMECGGAFYGVGAAPAGITIQKGVVVIENEHGSRSVDTSTYRFRYDAAAGRFVLIGYDFVDNDRATGKWLTESTNYLTNVRMVKSGKGNRTAGKRTFIKPTKIFLEDADQDELEGQALHRHGLD